MHTIPIRRIAVQATRNHISMERGPSIASVAALHSTAWRSTRRSQGPGPGWEHTCGDVDVDEEQQKAQYFYIRKIAANEPDQRQPTAMYPPDVEWRAHDNRSHSRRRRSGPEGFRTNISIHAPLAHTHTHAVVPRLGTDGHHSGRGRRSRSCGIL